jgi:hypothetical protein
LPHHQHSTIMLIQAPIFAEEIRDLTGCLPWMVTLLLLCSSLSAQDAWTNKSRILPDKLRLVPTQLTLNHGPNPNYPELCQDPKVKAKYVWKHSTTVCSPHHDLEVVAAGSFVWYSPSGWQENVQLSKREFARRFDCPQGLLRKGECFTYQKNYRYGNDLYGGDALWYVIARDAEGTHYKGFGIIETEGTLKNE